MRILMTTFVILFGFLFQGCKKEQPIIEPSANPCDCENPISADFEINESFGVVNGEWLFIETDSTQCPTSIQFKAKTDNATYRWYIGSQIYTGQEVVLDFQTNYIGTSISVTCVVEKNPNSYCFPDDDGYDSIIKTFYLSNFPIYNGPDQVYNYGIEGTYRVLNPTTNDSIDITVSFGNFEDIYNYAKVVNFDGLGSMSVDSTKRVTNACYRRIDFEGSTVLNYTKSLSGSIYNKMGGKSYLTFKTEYANTPGVLPEITEWNYVGRKLF